MSPVSSSWDTGTVLVLVLFSIYSPLPLVTGTSGSDSSELESESELLDPESEVPELSPSAVGAAFPFVAVVLESYNLLRPVFFPTCTTVKSEHNFQTPRKTL